MTMKKTIVVVVIIMLALTVPTIAQSKIYLPVILKDGDIQSQAINSCSLPVPAGVSLPYVGNYYVVQSNCSNAFSYYDSQLTGLGYVRQNGVVPSYYIKDNDANTTARPGCSQNNNPAYNSIWFELRNSGYDGNLCRVPLLPNVWSNKQLSFSNTTNRYSFYDDYFVTNGATKITDYVSGDYHSSTYTAGGIKILLQASSYWTQVNIDEGNYPN